MRIQIIIIAKVGHAVLFLTISIMGVIHVLLEHTLNQKYVQLISKLGTLYGCGTQSVALYV
jgi:hypothetical protein